MEGCIAGCIGLIATFKTLYVSFLFVKHQACSFSGLRTNLLLWSTYDRAMERLVNKVSVGGMTELRIAKLPGGSQRGSHPKHSNSIQAHLGASDRDNRPEAEVVGG